jgi:YceI-like protein
MIMMKNVAAIALCFAIGATGCDDKQTTLAPEATALQDTKPRAAGAQNFAIETKGSKVDFMMEAPREKIRGHVADATSGSFQIDPTDVTKTTAHLYVDIGGIELYQQVCDDATGKCEEEKKQELQNKHARDWLEIAEDAPPEVKKKNSNVEFVITKVEPDNKDVSKMTGAERKVNATVTGDFLLHGHKTVKTAKLEITFKYNGDKPESVSVKTTGPFAVGLAEHDVRPREAFGKIAKKTLDILVKEDKKVAEEAQVSVEFIAKAAEEAKK